MGKVSELHDDLLSVHVIVLGELQVALAAQGAYLRMEDTLAANRETIKVETLQGLLTAFEKHGIQFPEG